MVELANKATAEVGATGGVVAVAAGAAGGTTVAASGATGGATTGGGDELRTVGQKA